VKHEARSDGVPNQEGPRRDPARYGPGDPPQRDPQLLAFFRPDGSLFGYLECRDPERAFAWLARQEVWARWQQAMDRFCVKSKPEILGPDSGELEEVFHLR